MRNAGSPSQSGPASLWEGSTLIDALPEVSSVYDTDHALAEAAGAAKAGWAAPSTPLGMGSKRRSGDTIISSLLRWLPSERRKASGTDAAAQNQHLMALKQACRDALQDVPPHEYGSVQTLRCNITRARTAQDLWHLRTALYTEIARAHSQGEAQRRLKQLPRELQRTSPPN
ncbi:hypothetical protein ACG0Z6_15770 [Roseateles sp. BYS180W]|uniref:Uncharacterized protein n=1 Tax=Roseateles rivi TaxID=3299028 RepID=A0ABW7FZF2_9BURK